MPRPVSAENFTDAETKRDLAFDPPLRKLFGRFDKRLYKDFERIGGNNAGGTENAVFFCKCPAKLLSAGVNTQIHFNDPPVLCSPSEDTAR